MRWIHFDWIFIFEWTVTLTSRRFPMHLILLQHKRAPFSDFEPHILCWNLSQTPQTNKTIQFWTKALSPKRISKNIAGLFINVMNMSIKRIYSLSSKIYRVCCMDYLKVCKNKAQRIFAHCVNLCWAPNEYWHVAVYTLSINFYQFNQINALLSAPRQAELYPPPLSIIYLRHIRFKQVE